MKQVTTHPRRATLLVLLPLLALAGHTAFAAPPRSGSVAVTRTGPNGNTATRQSTLTTNGQGGYSASSTLTGPKGAAATRAQSGAYDPATKTYSRAGGTTGPNGRSSSFNTSVQATGTGYTRNATRTGPAGNNATSSRTVTTSPAH